MFQNSERSKYHISGILKTLSTEQIMYVFVFFHVRNRTCLLALSIALNHHLNICVCGENFTMASYQADMEYQLSSSRSHR